MNLEVGASMGNAISAKDFWVEQRPFSRQYFRRYRCVARPLSAIRYHVMVLWMRTLTRRSQKDRTGWDRINRLADQWLPKPRILHPWPNQRFAVKHPRWEPDAEMPHVRFCAGGAQEWA